MNLIILLYFFVYIGFVQVYASTKVILKRHTAFTKPLPLRPGEVTNSFHKLKIPKGPIAVHGFSADIIEFGEDGEVIPTPLYDAYLHHHVVGSNHKKYDSQKNIWTPMKPNAISKGIGFGAGTESRGTPQNFYHPYAFVTLEDEDTWIANVHVINTRGLSVQDAHHCSECPCTSENERSDGTINHTNMSWHACNGQLVEEKNTACFVNLYYGGLRCCEDGQFCLERDQLHKSPESTFYLRYTIEYAEVTPDIIPLYLASCCDATGDLIHHGNVEYDIPKCDPETNPGCIHTLSTKQYIRGENAFPFGVGTEEKYHNEIQDREVEIVYAVGHQHRGGLGVSLYNDKTKELICDSVPTYGNGKNIGNEKDYVISMSHCTFDPPLRMRTTDIVRVVGLYNSTEAHTGVMSLFYLALADVADEKRSEVVSSASLSSSHSSLSTATTFIVVGCMVCVLLGFAWRQVQKRRHEYSPLLERTMDARA